MKHYIIISLCALCLRLSASTHIVPLNYATISLAINASHSYDTIYVNPGTYNENIVIHDTLYGLKIISTNGAAATIIDGGGTNSVITIYGTDSNTVQTVIAGFTIQNGNKLRGAGCYFNNTRVGLNDNIIKDNISNDVNNPCEGAGIYSGFSSISMHGCQIINNTIVNSPDSRGAGISSQSSTLNIMNCEFSGNISYTNTRSYGGGIYQSEGSLNMHECIIKGNSVQKTSGNASWTFGAGLFLDRVRGDIVNTLICENTTDTTVTSHDGAAIYISTGATVTTEKLHLTHCTIANNFAGISNGTSLYNKIPASAPADALTLQNCILWSDNQHELLSGASYVPQLSNCDLKDTTNTGTNCIYLDPLFVSQADYHLQLISPCTNAALMLVANDLENNPRPIPAGNLPDIGCYEVDESLNGISNFDPGTAPDIRQTIDHLFSKNVSGSYQITNLSGQVVDRGILMPSESNGISLTKFTRGLYLLTVLTPDKKVIVHKFSVR